ncbi:hypothetical protein LguiB_013539 [Lonicera macranthoides]
MKLYKISSLILLIIILVAGYFIPYAASQRGRARGPLGGSTCTGVGGTNPCRGGLP